MDKAFSAQYTSSKRKRPAAEEEDLFDDLSSDGKEELSMLAETPSTLGRHRDAFITPSRLRTTDMGNTLPTPTFTTSVKKVLFKDPITAATTPQQPLTERSGEFLFGTPTVIGTPAAPRTPATPGTNLANLTRDVMALLEKENISNSARTAVWNTLNKYTAQAKGLEKGRDIARESVKELKGQLVLEKEKVTDLESSRQVLRTQLLNMYQKS
jgi:hypothetical protein